MATATQELLTPQHIETLRAGYDGIERVDPCGLAYNKLVTFLDRLSQPQLKQLADSKIKWVSSLARNRIK